MNGTYPDAGRPTRNGAGHLRPILLLLLTTAAIYASGPAQARAFSSVPADTTAADPDSSRIDPLRLGIVTGASVGGFVVGHVVLTDLWWKGESGGFHFNWTRDWRYALGADKVGHAVMPYIATDLYRGALEWSGLSHRSALWTAAGVSWTYMAYIEVRDGFSKEWGFSWGDMIANTIGVGWRVAEDYWPAMQGVRFKVSYWPSEAWRAGLYGSIVDDYESTYHWGSVDPEIFMPDSWGDIWPDWLNIALAHTVEGIVDYDGSGRHRFYLALDIDTEGLPGGGSFWRVVKRVLNYYHFPLPAIRIGRGLTIR